MQVLEDHQYPLSPRLRLELPQHRRKCPLLLALRAEVERREALAAGQRQHLGDQRDVARLRPIAEQRLQLVELCCGRVVASKPCGALQLADKGVERAVLIVRRAEIANSGMRLCLDALRQCCGGDTATPAQREKPTPALKLNFLIAIFARSFLRLVAEELSEFFLKINYGPEATLYVLSNQPYLLIHNS